MSTESFPVVIHHNPECGTSRNVVEIVRAAGYEPVIIEYLKTGWTQPQSPASRHAQGRAPLPAERNGTQSAGSHTARPFVQRGR